MPWTLQAWGQQWLKKLFAKELVQDVAGIYRLTVDDLLQLDGFKEKSAQKLVDAIQSSKGNSAEN